MTDLGIALQFPTPPLDLTHLEALPLNPYGPGLHFVDRVRGPIAVDAYGMYWQVHSTTPGIGQTIRTQLYFDRPLLEIRQIQEDLVSNVEGGPVIFTDEAAGYIKFVEFPILRVAIWVYPGCSFDLSWIVVF